MERSYTPWLNRVDAFHLIRTADKLQLGDRLFQNTLKELARVDGWIDAALLIAEAALSWMQPNSTKRSSRRGRPNLTNKSKAPALRAGGWKIRKNRGFYPMSIPDIIAEYYEHEREQLKRQVELLENGTLHTGERREGGPWVDTTAQSLERAKESLAEIEQILAEASKGKS